MRDDLRFLLKQYLMAVDRPDKVPYIERMLMQKQLWDWVERGERWEPEQTNSLSS